MTINWSIKTYDDITSTQDLLKEIIRTNPDLSEGTVIRAHRQSAGYGRHKRVWQGNEDNLYLSLLIKPDCKIENIGQLSLLVGFAISEVIDNIINPENTTTLKWPNDILINNKKCCGILIESSPTKDHIIDYVVIGIGVNLYASPMDTATCLQGHTQETIDSDDFTDKILSSIDHHCARWKKEGFQLLREGWLEKTYPEGSNIGVKIGNNKIAGQFDTIDIRGNLILMCNETKEKKKISSGDVFLL